VLLVRDYWEENEMVGACGTYEEKCMQDFGRETQVLIGGEY
jgi:hypothetical protein